MSPTIYNQIHALPRKHRLAVARWILANNPVHPSDWARVLGMSPQGIARRVAVSLKGTP